MVMKSVLSILESSIGRFYLQLVIETDNHRNSRRVFRSRCLLRLRRYSHRLPNHSLRVFLWDVTTYR